jgi:F-type H+-transporting ATPase subunit a
MATMETAENPLSIPFGHFGFENAINSLTVSWFVTLLILAILFLATRGMKAVPRGVQNFIEMIFEFVYGAAKSQVGKQADFFFPLFFYLFTFILFSNLMGLIPGFACPTSRVDMNLGMALVVFLSTHFWGIKSKGFKNYFAHFLPPDVPLDPNSGLGMKILMRGVVALLWVMMPPIHLIGELVKPFTLTLRLFGNMMGKEKVLAVSILLMGAFWGDNFSSKMVSVAPAILRVLITVLGVFVSFIQAFVFMFLSMVYIGEAVKEHEGGEGAH